MDVFLSQVNGALDSLDVLVGPVQVLALHLDLFQLAYHNLSLLDSAVDCTFKLPDQSLDVELHLIHGLLINTFGKVRFDLALLLLKFCKLLVFYPDLVQKTLGKTLLDVFFCRLLHRHDLTLHDTHTVLPLSNGLCTGLLHALSPSDSICGVHFQHFNLVPLVHDHVNVTLSLL